MLTNAGMDLKRHAQIEAEQLQSHLFDEAEAKAHAAAEQILTEGRPDQSPEVVALGSEEDTQDHFTFVDDGNEAKRIRAQRVYGNLRPAQYLVHPRTNHLLGPKMRNDAELEIIATGEACWRCGDFQPQDDHVVKERHRRLSNAFPLYSIPTGLTEKDCCCTCGAVLGLKTGAA